MTETSINIVPVSASDLAPAVQTIHLGVEIDGRRILRDVNVRVGRGEHAALLGANGAGKSTLLRVLAGLTVPSVGQVELFARRLVPAAAGLRRRVGLIAHQSMLYRDLSARENLEFFGALYGIDHPRRRARQMLDMIGLSTRREDPVRAFSRGMVQRVAVARALLHDPDVILADEPFTGLDAPSVGALERLFRDLANNGKAIVTVNHDIAQSLRLADRAIVLRGGRVAVDQPTHRLYEQEVLAEVSS